MEYHQAKPIRIIITGPESTGKTELCTQLSGRFKGVTLPEYARDYILSLNRSYTYNDLVHIAQTQIRQLAEISNPDTEIVFVDTYLVITKIWFLWVYKKYPEWIDAELEKTIKDLYLLCDTDLPWVADQVRENGGVKRQNLFEEYKLELIRLGANFHIINGKGDNRIDNAIKIIKEFIEEKEFIG